MRALRVGVEARPPPCAWAACCVDWPFGPQLRVAGKGLRSLSAYKTSTQRALRCPRKGPHGWKLRGIV